MITFRRNIPGFVVAVGILLYALASASMSIEDRGEDSRSLSFSGNLMVQGEPYSGEAKLKLAIRSGKSTIWESAGNLNRMTSLPTPLSVDVVQGSFRIDIGIEEVTDYFTSSPDKLGPCTLYVWADVGDGFELLGKQYAVSVGGQGGADTQARVAPGLIRNPDIVVRKTERKKSGKKKPKNPLGLARERVAKRGDPTMEDLIKGRDQFKSLLQAQAAERDAGLWNWEWLGPGNIGGRIRTILIHPTKPDTMWIAGVAGGIWVTHNGGAYWQPVNDFMANLAVTTMVMDPNNPNVMYAGTGEIMAGDGLPGLGIFKSIDGGVTWNQLPSTANAAFKWVSRLEHHPVRSDTLFAAIAWRVMRSDDGGFNWTEILADSVGIPTDLKGQPMDIKISSKVAPFAGHYMLVGTSTDAYASIDTGNNWALITTGVTGRPPASAGRCEVAFWDNSNPPVEYLSIDNNKGEVWWSFFDGSSTTYSLLFSNYQYLEKQGGYDNAISVGSGAPIVVGGIDLWRGNTATGVLTRISDWREYRTGLSAHSDHHAIVPHPNYDGVTNKTVFIGNDGGIQKTDDITNVTQTSGWTNLANNLGITQFYGGAAAPDGSIIVGGAQDNDKLRYIPGTGTGSWYQAETGDGGFAAVNYNNPSVVYGEYVNLKIYKSTNGGDSYSAAINGLTDADTSGRYSLFIAPFVMDPNDPDILVAGGTSIWRTTNAAGSWSQIRDSLGNPGPKCTAIDIAKGNSQIIWVGYKDGTVSMTSDGGTNWTDVDDPTSGPIPQDGRWITDIAISPTNSNEVFITLGDYADSNVFITIDAGQTWEDRTGDWSNGYNVPKIQVNSIRYHPLVTNWVYIGTDFGVLASEDKGLTWSVTTRYDDNEGPVNTEVSELFWQGDEYLLAATHGRGMYRCRPMSIIYVDGNWNGQEDGSQQFPYNTVQEALDSAGNGTAIVIKSNTYNEAPTTIIKRGQISVTGGSVIIQ